ncbi:MAG: phosphate signaling complex protein PhoU [Candidatus Poribacteria bacterium]|nr:phosphate signaling complex protein PhoU [Candidatus Poribacteria bacterium]
MQRRFELELSELQQKLLVLGGLAEDMLHRAVESVLNRNGELAQAVIDSDDQADALENEIEEYCIQLIALHQPAASDVRFLTMAMKINRDLERMADKAVDIAQRCLELMEHAPVKPFIDLPRVARIVQEMVKDTLDAFVNRDAILAQEVRERDKQVDAIYDQTLRELLTYMIERPELVRPGISTLLLFRHLERIGDLAANIGEEVYYLVEGDVIRHQRAAKLKEKTE